eukprot:5479680-Prymnesium_polylepis.2
MSYDEFLEAVLRIGVKIETSHLATIERKFRTAAELLAGELEGAHIKLSRDRMDELLKQEMARLDKEKVRTVGLCEASFTGRAGEGRRSVVALNLLRRPAYSTVCHAPPSL